MVDHNPPTTTMFALGCPSVVAAHKQPATVTPQGYRDGMLMIPPRDSKHEVDLTVASPKPEHRRLGETGWDSGDG